MLLSVLLTALMLVEPQAAPALPDVPLTTFPAAAQAALSRVLEAARKRPSDPVAVGTLGRWLHAWEQWDAAHQAYTRAQALSPRSFEWHYLDAVILQRLARQAEAAGRLKQAAALKPDYLPARVKLAEALLEAGDLKESKPLFEQLDNDPVSRPAAQLGLGRIAMLEGRQDAAIQHFEAAIALFPEFGTAHYALARAYRAAGRADDARRALEQHARFGARWPGIEDPVLAAVATLREDPRAILKRGIASAEAGDLPAAIALHEAVLVRDPSLVQAHANLLSLYGRARDWPKAEAEYRKALAAGFENADLHYDFAVVLGLQEKWAEAETAYRKAIAINPLHANARNNLGQILERRREFAEAASQYRQAIEAQPSFRLGRFNLGRMLLAVGDTAQAIGEFERIQQPIDAETPRYVFALSTAYVRAGRMADGLRLASDARKLALEFGQTELAAAIAREVAKLK